MIVVRTFKPDQNQADELVGLLQQLLCEPPADAPRDQNSGSVAFPPELSDQCVPMTTQQAKRRSASRGRRQLR
jgi:hypothetical protein